MTQEDQLKTIQKIAKALAPKYVFDCYEREDIEQEAVLMGIEALPRWDSSRPLENFLYTHINNRLKNFKRDNYCRLGQEGEPEKIQQNKKNILDAVCLNESSVQIEIDLDALIDKKELMAKIEFNLPAKNRKDFLRLIAGSRISQKKKEELLIIIRNILGI